MGLVLPAAAPGLRLKGVGYLVLATVPDLGRGVTPLIAAPDLGLWVSLYRQQKQDQELTVAQIMNSLLLNSDLN